MRRQRIASPRAAAGGSRIRESNKSSTGIQSLETGLAVAFALARAGRRLSLTEISNQLAILPSTVHRHLASLSRLGLVQQAEPNGRYELGPGAAEFGFAALRGLDAQQLWAEALSRLRDEMGLTSLIVVWGTFGPTIVQWKPSLSPVTLHAHLGAVLPLLTSASGHVFCAFSDDAITKPLMDREFGSAKRRTFLGKPLTRKSFRSVVANVRAEQLAVVQGDLHGGVDSLSAPVFRGDGDLQLALTILAATGDIDLDSKGAHAKTLKRTAAWLCSALGYAAAGQSADGRAGRK